jgi:hypothetical protein
LSLSNGRLPNKFKCLANNNILQHNNTVYNLWIWIYHINLSSMVIINLRYSSETIDGCNNFNGEKIDVQIIKPYKIYIIFYTHMPFCSAYFYEISQYLQFETWWRWTRKCVPGSAMWLLNVWTLNMTQLSFTKKIDIYVSLIFYNFGALIYYFRHKINTYLLHRTICYTPSDVYIFYSRTRDA